MATIRNRAWETCVFLLKLAVCLATMYAVAFGIVAGTAARDAGRTSDSDHAAAPVSSQEVSP